MLSEKRRIRNKKIIIAVLCTVLVAVALFGATYTRYTSEIIRGRVEYDPALFNTVLLGRLVDADVHAITQVEEEQAYPVTVYTCSNPHCQAHISYGSGGGPEVCAVCPYCGQENPYIDEEGEEHPFTVSTYTQLLNRGKIMQNLDLSESIEFGKRDSHNVLKVAPGTEEKNYGHVFFTVTNGTTLETVYRTEGGTEVPTAQVANTADSDIRYTLHIITSNNLPLEYRLKDVDTGMVYDLTDTLEKKVSVHYEAGEDGEARTETVTEKQETSDYVVQTHSESASDFINGTRILKRNVDDSITVHQYELIITWPSKSVVKETVYDDRPGQVERETQYNNDISYMKELENVQVLLEVESYVHHMDAIPSDTTADGILYLNRTPLKDGLYFLRTADGDAIPFYSRKIARFDAGKEAEASEIGVEGAYAYNYRYRFHIYNTQELSAEWVADNAGTKTYIDPLTGKSPTRAENGQTDNSGEKLINGHYEYSGDSYIPGTYDLILAVPAGLRRMNGSNTDWGSENDYRYYIVYDGETYVGEKSEEVVQSTTQTYDEHREDTYMEEDVTQYQGYRFYRTETNDAGNVVSKTELSLSFQDGSLQVKDIALYRSSRGAYEKCKDDFRIYLTRSEEMP